MARVLSARVHVAVVLGNEVHVMEDEAIEVSPLPRLYESQVHKAPLVERLLAVLDKAM